MTKQTYCSKTSRRPMTSWRRMFSAPGVTCLRELSVWRCRLSPPELLRCKRRTVTRSGFASSAQLGDSVPGFSSGQRPRELAGPHRPHSVNHLNLSGRPSGSAFNYSPGRRPERNCRCGGILRPPNECTTRMSTAWPPLSAA